MLTRRTLEILVIVLSVLYLFFIVLAFICPWVTISRDFGGPEYHTNWWLYTAQTCNDPYEGAGSTCTNQPYHWQLMEDSRNRHEQQFVAGLIFGMIFVLAQFVLCIVAMIFFGCIGFGTTNCCCVRVHNHPTHWTLEKRRWAAHIYLTCAIIALVCWVLVVALLYAYVHDTGPDADMSAGFAFQIIAWIIAMPLAVFAYWDVTLIESPGSAGMKVVNTANGPQAVPVGVTGNYVGTYPVTTAGTNYTGGNNANYAGKVAVPV